jgi:hypothetical protein
LLWLLLWLLIALVAALILEPTLVTLSRRVAALLWMLLLLLSSFEGQWLTKNFILMRQYFHISDNCEPKQR